DRSIEIREVATGVARQAIAYPAEVSTIEFSPDGRLLAIGGESARIWNVAENRLLDQQWPHPQRIDSLKFNRAGTRLITTAEDKLARVFAVDDVGRPAPLYDPLPHVPERPPSSPVLVNGDRQLVTIANYGQLAVWDLETGSEQKRITTKPKALCLVAADPLGRFFATGGYYGPSLWRADAMDDPPVEMDHVNFVDHIVFSADGTLMMSVSWDSTAQLWSVPDGRPLGPRITHNTGAHRVAISDDNQYLVTSQDNRLVRVWKRPDTTRLIARTPKWGKVPRLSSDGLLATPGRFYASPLVEHGTTPEVVVRRTSDGAPIGPTIRDGRMVVDTCICGDNRTLAIVSQGNQGAKLTLWDPYAGQQIRDPMDLPGVPLSVAARPATDHLVIVCQRDTLLAVDWKSGRVLFTHSGEAKSLSDDIPDGRFASYTPDGKRIVAMTDNISARVYDADSGELCFPPLQTVYEERLPFRTFSISPDSRLLATGANGVARVWDLGNGRELCRPLLHPDNQLALSDLEFSPDNRLLITANTDGLARVWDWQQGELACPPLKHDDVVFTVAFTPDGRHAVTGSRGPHCGPHVWELTTGKPIAPPLIDPQGGSNKDAVHGVAIAPDGSRLVAGASSSGDFVIADLQRLLAPTDIPVQDLQLVSEAAATKAIEAGDLNTLTLEQWRTRWSRLTENRLARETASPLEIMRRRTKLAADAQSRGDFDEALRQLQIAWEASESDTFDPNGPNAVQIAAGLADIQFRQVSIYRTTQRHAEFTEALERARVWAEQALALDPHNHSRRTQLTGVLWLVGEGQPTNPLDSQLRNAVRILGSNTISSLAAVYLLAGEPNKAVSSIQQIDAERLTAIDLALLAIGQQRLEQTAEASEALERGLNALAELNFPESAMALAESALVEIKGITLDEANAHVRQLKTAHALKPFDEAIASDPESPRGYANRGEWHGAHGNWELAAADLSKAIEIEPEDHFSAYHLCSLFAARENADAYRAHRTMMLAKWGESREDTIAERTAMGCLLREPSVDELEQLKEIMQYVEEVTPNSRFRIWFTRCIALYRYRLGKYEDVLKATQQGRNWIGP
ncbi:MAG: hypothetical protein KDA99_20845, partial [Planctomycetales bacterium]|nr:hypothetical protein [Planctomycetales bacterium]